MDYPGDFPPTPEERAAYRLAANAAWLTRINQRAGDPAGVNEEMMKRDNRVALAAARKAIDAERRSRKCYVCGRQDLPRYARRFGIGAVVFFGFTLLGSNDPRAVIFGYLAAGVLGAAFAAGMYEGVEPDDEEALRKKFNETAHS